MTVQPHVRGRREVDGIESRRHLVVVVLRAWFPVGDRVHHLVVVEQSRTKKFGGKMKQTLHLKRSRRRDENTPIKSDDDVFNQRHSRRRWNIV